MLLTLIKKLMFCDIFNVIFFIPRHEFIYLMSYFLFHVMEFIMTNEVCEKLLGFLKLNKSLYVMLIYFSIIIVSFVSKLLINVFSF